MKLSRKTSKLCAALVLVSFLSGCAQISYRESTAVTTGAVIGTLLGAGAGGGIAAATTKHNREITSTDNNREKRNVPKKQVSPWFPRLSVGL